jgi:hypothetical protein
MIFDIDRNDENQQALNNIFLKKLCFIYVKLQHFNQGFTSCLFLLCFFFIFFDFVTGLLLKNARK